MMGWAVRTLGSVIVAAAMAGDLGGQTARYTVLADPAAEQVHVRVMLSDFAGDVGLEFPEAYAFVRLDGPLLAIAPILEEADEPGAAETPDLTREGPFRWTVRGGGPAPLHLRYTVAMHHRELPEVQARDTYEHPYLADDHGLLVAGAIFLAPTDESAKLHVEFELPDAWPVVSSWPPAASGGLAPSATEIRQDLIAIGHWETMSADVDGFGLHVAVAPGQGSWRETVVPRIREIVAAELELFGMRPRERYLFLFGRPDMPGFAGSPKTGSMTLQVDPALPASMVEGHLTHLIAHEFHHTWTAALTHMPDELRFYNEGFTDYCAYMVTARLGYTSDQEFNATVAGKMSTHEQSARASALSLADAGGPAFFEGGVAYHQTYDGGLVLAAWLDLALRIGAGVTLDEFMREFNGTATVDRPPGLADLTDHVAEFLGDEVGVWFQETVKQPGPIDWVEAFAAMDVEVTVSRRILPLDFRVNLRDGAVSAIDPEGAAYVLGLRTGDLVLEVNGKTVQSENEARQAFRAPAGDVLSMLVERDGQRITLAGNRPERSVYTIELEVFADTLDPEQSP